MNPKAEGTWYCDFLTPNKQYFTLHLDLLSGVPNAELKLRVDRSPTDNRMLNVDFKLHIEISGPFVALLAKDKNEPEGALAMIVKPSEDGASMSGRVIWNSIRRGTIEEQTMDWTRTQSDENRNAYLAKP